jgi:spermidine/putrescine transport system permease protein
MVGKGIKRTYTFLIFFFLYAPIFVLIAFSFNESKSRGVWTGFTLKWYAELFSDREVLEALYNTLLIAMGSAMISTVIGTAAAIGIHWMKGFRKTVVVNLNYLPVLNPDIVTAVSLMTLYRALSLDFGMITLLLSHVVFCTPYVVLSVLPKLKQMNTNLAEVAMDLGATPLYAIRKVVVPEIMPGIVTGALIAFTLSIDDFVISFFNTGHGVSNLSILIYSMARRGINPVINALSTLMFAFLLVLLLYINRRADKEQKRVAQSE